VNPSATDGGVLWPLVVYFFAAVLVVTGMIAVSYILGQRHRERATAEPYESGIASTGSAQVRFDVGFYLVAMFFVIFDLESAFIFAWAIAVRELGWIGYSEVVIFIGMFIIVLIYLWRLGALDWAPAMRSIRNGREKGG
jgi:NADH-quinone oxidoreductase subunit A